MKIRIQDHSVRYRISIKELEEFNRTGRLESVTEVYSEDGSTCEGRFLYAVATGADSGCEIGPGGITLRLSEVDRKTLNDPSEEGVYLRRETPLPGGVTHRFMAFIEKDRPATRCDKPEAWIYEAAPDGSPISTRPVGGA